MPFNYQRYILKIRNVPIIGISEFVFAENGTLAERMAGIADFAENGFSQLNVLDDLYKFMRVQLFQHRGYP